MTLTEEELAKMHWRDRWEYEARQEAKALRRLGEQMLLGRIQRGQLGLYYQMWHVIGDKGTVGNAAPVLWDFLQQHPGDSNMLHRYHCAAALFKILGMPDPACENALRKRVQWDHDGETARQAALLELAELIQKQLDNL